MVFMDSYIYSDDIVILSGGSSLRRGEAIIVHCAEGDLHAQHRLDVLDDLAALERVDGVRRRRRRRRQKHDLAGDELRLLRVLLLDKQLLLIDVAQPQQRGSEQHCGGHYCPLCHPSPPNTLHIHREEPITHHPH